jgi:hypothetical protein
VAALPAALREEDLVDHRDLQPVLQLLDLDLIGLDPRCESDRSIGANAAQVSAGAPRREIRLW